MFRFRRYRVFLICAFVITVLLYHVSKNSQWDRTQEIWHSTKHRETKAETKPVPKPPAPVVVAKPPVVKEDPAVVEVEPPKPAEEEKPKPKVEEHDHDHGHGDKGAQPTVKIPTLKEENKEKGTFDLPTKSPPLKGTAGKEGVTKDNSTPATIPDRLPGSGIDAHKGHSHAGEIGDSTPAQPDLATTTVIHWTKPSEWFPIPDESVIPLPTGKPKPIPAIQAKFGPESPEAKEKRELRLAKVKAEAQRAWTGYKIYAWTHDELRPVSKASKDPFCGWAATLVDSLDTLWIMGLKDEFEDALKAVKEIDFTTTPYRHDIPVFETIIRYLGGLIAAYDISGQKKEYKLLLDKAEELAEILMSVFDTPNRLPILYYQWHPAYNIAPKRASPSSGVAELGSMSMEFTRLAQLTGKNRYYDAVARITDAFEELQNWKGMGKSAIEGIFPEHLDASGCNKSAPWPPVDQDREDGRGDLGAVDVNGVGVDFGTGGTTGVKVQKRETEVRGDDGVGGRDGNVAIGEGQEQEKKRDGPTTAATTASTAGKPKKKLPDGFECAPQGLVGGGWGGGSYGMGGSQDSAYEYFPKQYLLLGGLVPKYKTMHEKTVAAVKKYLLFRPMAKGDPDILFSAKATSIDGTAEKLNYEWEITHLTCFLGGMFGLGGKIFESPEDVEIGKKLAEGCFWAYDVMPTGIMPEHATIMPCKSATDCKFNETAWHEKLDFRASYRAEEMERYYESKSAWKKQVEEIKKQQALQKERVEKAKTEAAKRPVAENTGNTNTNTAAQPKTDSQPAQRQQEEKPRAREGSFPSRFQRRQLNATSNEPRGTDLQNSLDLNSAPAPKSNANTADDFNIYSDDDTQIPLTELTLPPEPIKPMSHEEYIADRLKNEIIPLASSPSLTNAISSESIWYMYRITGDPIWQEKGWKMFESVIKHAQTEVGHSALRDVTVKSDGGGMDDSMESFWLAETLKYFYLLFAEPEVVSLDEWVLNTEAHPFRRPT
ncbi:glycosyl hydrolase family 47-domain-containing protein [Apiosordaria backusii]|uniref:alpha-1,2-Mannosidase n=1 Tax=Apiosordaria backusii TaxID=314023 RepID=A0AA40AT45_9PEZI|nr:glycosyl hydrolase family 47-domain-containing protein [Apiosordaria backusii]